MRSGYGAPTPPMKRVADAGAVRVVESVNSAPAIAAGSKVTASARFAPPISGIGTKRESGRINGTSGHGPTRMLRGVIPGFPKIFRYRQYLGPFPSI